MVPSCWGTNISPRTIPPSENSPRTIPPGQFPLPIRPIPPLPLKTQLENYIYTCMYAHMHTLYTYMHINIDACTHVYMHTIHTCIHTYIYSCIHIHLYTVIYIDIFWHTYTYM